LFENRTPGLELTDRIEWVAIANCEALQLEGVRDVTPVVLGFNCEVHNAPDYKFNDSA